MNTIQPSYWDKSIISSSADVTVVGAGITGLSCALRLQSLRPQLSIQIVDKHVLSRVASTRNAGFSCFGSLTELISDREKFGEETMTDLVNRRWKGMQLISEKFEAGSIDYHKTGGYELISNQSYSIEKLNTDIKRLNKILYPIFGSDVFRLVERNANNFGFSPGYYIVENRFEGQLNPALYISSLKKSLNNERVSLVEGLEVFAIQPKLSGFEIETSHGLMNTRHVVLATNGLTSLLNLNVPKIYPARNIVLVSQEFNVPFKGVFHAEEGYIYFRNVDNRLLIGGGRHWAKSDEQTADLGTNDLIVAKLKKYVEDVVLNGKHQLEYDYQWSGIMGTTEDKLPVLTKTQNGMYVAAGLNGMGVALGMELGFEGADKLIDEESL